MTTEFNKILVGCLAVVLLGGCAPQFVEPAPEQQSMGWFERRVILSSDTTEPAASNELVLVGESARVLDGSDRVRWIKGIDLENTRIQRPAERDLGQSASKTDYTSLSKTYVFGIAGGSLSAEGRLALDSFRKEGGGRYFVEFLHKGGIDEVAMHEMTTAWIDLAKELTARGIPRDKFIMGGSLYQQPVNAIVIMKVGK